MATLTTAAVLFFWFLKEVAARINEPGFDEIERVLNQDVEESALNQSQVFIVGTYNVWNLMFEWTVRFEHIAQLIRQSHAHVVGLQEIRRFPDGSNQIDSLRRLIPEVSFALFNLFHFYLFIMIIILLLFTRPVFRLCFDWVLSVRSITGVFFIHPPSIKMDLQKELVSSAGFLFITS
jgi:hypothetical protein